MVSASASEWEGADPEWSSFDPCPKSLEHAACALPEPLPQHFVEFEGLQWITLLWTCPAAFWTHLKFPLCRFLQGEEPQLSSGLCEKGLFWTFQLLISLRGPKFLHSNRPQWLISSLLSLCLIPSSVPLCPNFLFPILKGPNLFGCFSFGSCFIPLMTFAAFPWTFFISTLLFSKQKAQTVPSSQDAGKPWIDAVAESTKINILSFVP